MTAVLDDLELSARDGLLVHVPALERDDRVGVAPYDERRYTHSAEQRQQSRVVHVGAVGRAHGHGATGLARTAEVLDGRGAVDALVLFRRLVVGVSLSDDLGPGHDKYVQRLAFDRTQAGSSDEHEMVEVLRT